MHRDAKVLIGGLSKKALKAEIEAYDAERREAKGIWQNLKIRVKQQFSPIPRLREVLQYYELRHLYLQQTSALDAYLALPSESKDIENYLDRYQDIARRLPRHALSNKQYRSLRNWITDIRQAKNGRQLAMQKKRTSKKSKIREKSYASKTMQVMQLTNCSTIIDVNRQYRVFQQKRAVELIEQLSSLYRKHAVNAAQQKRSKGEVTLDQLIEIENEYIRVYRSNVADLKQWYKQQSPLNASNSININKKTNLSDCKSFALSSFIGQQIEKTLGLLEYEQDGEMTQNSLETIRRDIGVVHDVLIKREYTIKQNENRPQGIEYRPKQSKNNRARINRDEVEKYLQACGAIHYLMQSKVSIFAYREHMEQIAKTAAYDFQRRQFSQVKDIKQFFELMKQRLANVVTHHTSVGVEPELPAFEIYHLNKLHEHGRQAISQGHNLLIRLFKNIEIRTIQTLISIKKTHKVKCVAMQEQAKLSMVPINFQNQLKQKQREKRLDKIKRNKTESIEDKAEAQLDFDITPSMYYLRAYVEGTKEYKENNWAKGRPAWEYRELFKKVDKLVHLWIDTFKVYKEYIQQMRAMIQQDNLQDAINTIETSIAEEPWQRVLRLKAFFNQSYVQYLQTCDADSLNKLYKRWHKSPLIVHADKNAKHSNWIHKLMRMYEDYFLKAEGVTDEHARKFNGALYWSQLHGLLALLSAPKSNNQYLPPSAQAFSWVDRFQPSREEKADVAACTETLPLLPHQNEHSSALVCVKKKQVEQLLPFVEEMLVKELYEPAQLENTLTEVEQIITDLTSMSTYAKNKIEFYEEKALIDDDIAENKRIADEERRKIVKLERKLKKLNVVDEKRSQQREEHTRQLKELTEQRKKGLITEEAWDIAVDRVAKEMSEFEEKYNSSSKKSKNKGLHRYGLYSVCNGQDTNMSLDTQSENARPNAASL